MLVISNDGTIRISRGDSFNAVLFINRGSEIKPIRYEVSENDSVYFGVMEPNQSFEDAIIRKKYGATDTFNENGDLVISFFPKDTENLLPGRYYYSVKLSHIDDNGNELVDTLIPERQFYIER